MNSESVHNQQSVTNAHGKGKGVGFAIAAIVLLILLVTAVLVVKKPGMNADKDTTGIDTQNSAENTQNNPDMSGADAKMNRASSFPLVSVNNWSIPDSITVPVTSFANVYQLKQNLSISNQTSQQSALTAGAKNEETDKRLLSVKSDDQGNPVSMYYFVKETGSFLYTNDEGLELPQSGTVLSDQEKITSYVRSLVGDDKIHITAQYEKRGKEGVRYYELHRDWSAMGLPVYNMLGLFNIDNSQSLASITQMQAPTKQAIDNAIIKTSDGSDGFKRGDDFNTVTVGVQNGKIVSVLSNIRPIASTSNATLISYSEAVNRLKAKKYASMYITPDSATQAVKDAPQGQVSLTDAQVTEVTVAYLENLPISAQQKLEPFYIFRGSGTLASGKTVHFLASVAAVPSNVMGVSTENSDLMALNNPANGGQQQGTLDMNGNPIANNTQPQSLDCKAPTSAQLVNQVTAANGVVYGQYTYKDKLEWYFVPPTTFVDLAVFQSAFDTLKLTANVTNKKRTDVSDIVKDLERATSLGCPIRLSGSSPSLFVYGTDGQKIVVKTGAHITLAQPLHQNGVWNVVTGAKGITVNGHTAEYIYYEYSPVTFTKPANGWNVAKSELNSFADGVSAKLGLTSQEAARVRFELESAAAKVKSESLFVGLIDTKELNNKVPLSAVGTNSVTRVHFYVSGSDGTSVSAPQLYKVVRPASYVLEFGAAAH